MIDFGISPSDTSQCYPGGWRDPKRGICGKKKEDTEADNDPGHLDGDIVPCVRGHALLSIPRGAVPSCRKDVHDTDL